MADPTPPSDQTQKTTITPIVLPPLPASGQQIYDQIMGGIEPDLTTAMRGTLDEKYKGETPEQNKERLARYNAALVKYDKQYAAYVAQMKGSVRTFEHNARESIEKNARSGEQSMMDTMISSINSL